jgi:hypothetical protein
LAHTHKFGTVTLFRQHWCVLCILHRSVQIRFG